MADVSATKGRKLEMPYERDSDYTERTHIRRVPDMGARVNLEIWIVITVSGTLAFGIVIAWVLWVLNTYPIVKVIFVCATAAVPIIGIAMSVLKLYEMLCRATGHQTQNIGKYGTVFRTRRGRIQVVSPEETYAMESVDARRSSVKQLPPPTDSYETFVQTFNAQYPDRPMPVLEDLHPNPATSFPAGNNTYRYPGQEIEAGAVAEAETGSSLDDAAILLHSEQLAAKKAVELQKREHTKQRIRSLLAAGMKHRRIAVQVGMSGGSYHKYQAICEEMGIDTNE